MVVRPSPLPMPAVPSGGPAHEALTNGTLVESEGVGHLPHLEGPKRFHAELAAFLN